MRNKDPTEPNSKDFIGLANQLIKRYHFTDTQAKYLSVNAYGYLNDIISEVKHIESNINSIKKVLEDLNIW